MSWKKLPTDYTDANWDGLKKYTKINNSDGSISFEDITEYTQKENSFFGAKDANEMNNAMNRIMGMVENGTDLYDDFENYFNTQKALFDETANSNIHSLNSKYQDSLSIFEQSKKSEFDSWFETIKNKLSESDAGKIMQEIKVLKDKIVQINFDLDDQIEQIEKIDQVIEQGTKDGWEYEKRKSGTLKLWLTVENDTGWSVVGSAWNNMWWEKKTFTFPIEFTETPIAYGNIDRVSSGFSTGCTVMPTNTTVTLMTGGSQKGSNAHNLQIYAFGKYK